MSANVSASGAEKLNSLPSPPFLSFLPQLVDPSCRPALSRISPLSSLSVIHSSNLTLGQRKEQARARDDLALVPSRFPNISIIVKKRVLSFLSFFNSKVDSILFLSNFFFSQDRFDLIKSFEI